jgi:hypothetical protein
MDTNPRLRQFLDGSAHIHRVAPESIEFGNDQYVALFQPIA